MGLQSFATHLVGGEMTYVKLSGSTFRVTLTVYRDNYNGNPNALFDDPAVISFYNDNGTFLEAIEVVSPTVTTVPQILQPCQDAFPNIDFQKGVYIFDVDLSTITNYNANLGVYMVYARCCRSGVLIDNLFNADDQGFSSIVRIPPLSIVNNTPVFNNLTQYLCTGRQNLIDFSATETDGDSLYYSLCDPFLGLSGLGTGQQPPAADMNALNAGTVNYLNYGPPYNTVNWDVGYSANNPFGGGTINLDPNTGLMTLNPPNQGTYVMGVCVSEYRNGVLLSTVTRDFQYLVAPCDYPEIIVETNTSLGLDPETGFNIISAKCNEGLVYFDASNSIDIDSFSWDFGVPGISTDVGTGATPSYFYADTGTYYVTLTGITTNGCIANSDTFVVYIYPIFEPEFTFQDSCLNMDVQFFDNTISTSSTVNSWTWNFGDPNTLSDTAVVANPSYGYTSAGTFTASLIVTTDKGCLDTATHQITVHPLPEPSFTLSNPRCLGEEVNFDNTSTIESGTIQSYDWLIESNSFNTEDVDYTFSTAGTFPIQLIEVSSLGCADTLLQNIVINPLPTINVVGNSPICPNTDVQLTANSSGNVFNWSPGMMLDDSTIYNPIASLDTTPTTFYVEVTDVNSCQNKDSIFIDLLPLPLVDAGLDTSVCLNATNVVSFNTTVDLQASGGVDYVWTPNIGLSNPNISNPEASPTTTTTYIVTVTDINGCENFDSVDVVVLNPALELIEVDIDSLCFGDTVYVDVLDLGNVTTYSWIPTSFVTDASVREPGFFPPSSTSYVLETVNYCYLDRDSISIEVVSPPAVDAGPLDSICLGDDPYQLNAQPNNLEFYQWTTNDISISDIYIPNPTVAPITDTWYYLYAVDTIGSLSCESNDSVQLLVYEPPTLSLNYPADYRGFICLGDTLDLTATTNDGILFDWTSNNGTSILNADSNIASVIPSDSTIFYHTVTNVHACSSTDSIAVDVQLPVIAEIEGDTVMCFGFYVDLEASGGLYYQWYPNEVDLFSTTSNSFTQAYPDSSQTVYVAVSNDCFVDTAYHDITVNQLPLADAGEDILIYRDETGFLNGSGEGTPLWYTENRTIEGFVSNPNVFNPEMSPFNTTTYVLEVTDDLTGCLNYDTATVNVEVLTLLAFPTGFSPNGDGVNDLAHIIKYLNIKELENLSIYNRYGEEIFRTENFDGEWNGTYKGENVEIGSYIWVINAITKDNEKIQRKGNITIIR